jgi:4a-hydroxytetrahydrobiopterin dehydratase
MSTPPQRLDATAVAALVASLDGWTLPEPTWLERTWRFGDFDEAVAFMNDVFAVARAQDHHPNLANVYSEVTIRLSTHDAGGITERDADFAQAVSALPSGARGA